jgi:septal ring factor EnvC (AmiA/AmiB activator)
MNNISPDFVDETKYERHSEAAVPIKFGKKWLARSNKDKIEYLIKLASSLNHAAVKIQEERNELSGILFEKERQLTACIKGRDQDREMIQKQLLKENATKQMQAKQLQVLTMEKKELRAEIKRLTT